jgi:hypothetical protein
VAILIAEEVKFARDFPSGPAAIPAAERDTARGWVQKTAPEFIFTVKAWQKFTHSRKLGEGAADSKDAWQRFDDSANRSGGNTKMLGNDTTTSIQRKIFAGWRTV